ncbi:MAG: hypothetical protein K9G31_09625 [Crocinitomicaceae bacterium]|nr:hypothetical protein [Crocinitomicaceae bacterium]
MLKPTLLYFLKSQSFYETPKQSIFDNVINPTTASLFIAEFGMELSIGIVDCYEKGESFENLIDALSRKASDIPAIDIEEYIKPSHLANMDDLKKWRKEEYWSKHIKNMIDLYIENATTRYNTISSEYEEYRKIQDDPNLGQEIKDSYKDLTELGF